MIGELQLHELLDEIEGHVLGPERRHKHPQEAMLVGQPQTMLE